MTLKKKIEEVFTVIGHITVRMAERWADESEYEDIEDYRSEIQKALTKAALPYRVHAMTKRPFGFKIKIEDQPVHFFAKLNAKTITLSAKTERSVR